jgi:hypothetical protein
VHEAPAGLRYLAMGPEEMEIFFKRMFALRIPKDAWIYISEGYPVLIYDPSHVFPNQ